MKKVIEVAKVVMERRHIELNETEIEILNSVFDLTQEYRKNF